MAAPRAVKQMAKKATKLQEQIVADPDKAGEETPPVSDPPVQLNKAPGKEDPPIKPGEEPNPSEHDAEYWKKRFVGMQRAHDVATAEWKEKFEVQENQISEMTEQVKALREQMSSIDQANKGTKTDENIEISPEEIEEYGQPLIDLISKVSKGSGDATKDLAKQVLDLESRLENLEKGQEAIVERTVVNSQETFESRLSRKVPDWEQINDNEAFKEWLSEEVPYTGRERQDFLVEAHKALDVDKVAKFFTDWKAQTGGSALPNEGDPASPTPIPDNSSSSVVDTDVAATRGKIWLSSEINKFYKDKREGKYNKTQELMKEARIIEKDILAAGREGRIRKR